MAYKYKNLLSGKTALITGANEGLGLQTATELAARDCKVILASNTDSQRARDKIIEETGNKEIDIKTIDLASLDSVRKFVKDFLATERKLDILINNAGVYSAHGNTIDGLNKTLQINHFGPFLLTYLLSDILVKSGRSKIVFVSSSTAFYSNLNMFNLTHPSAFDFLTYSNSKLCTMVATLKFAEKLKKFGVTCNCVHPGMLKTNFLLKSPSGTLKYEFLQPFFKLCLNTVTRDVNYGAKSLIHLVTSKELEHVTGKYFDKLLIHHMPSKLNDWDFCEQIFQFSEYFVKITAEEKLRLMK